MNPWNLFGDQSNAFNPYAQNMFGLAQSYNPYMNLGMQNMNAVSGEAQNMVNNPAAEQNMLASQYYASPYQQRLMQNTTNMLNANAANTGMLGSQAAQKNLGNNLMDMSGQFQQQYVDTGLNQFNKGMGYQMGLGNMGLQALQGRNELMGQGYGAQLQGARSQDQAMSNMFGDAMGIGLMGAMGYF